MQVHQKLQACFQFQFHLKDARQCVVVQLQIYLDEAEVLTGIQLAYRKHCSTENALLNIQIIFSFIWLKGLSQPSPSWISPLLLTSRTTPFSLTGSTYTMESVNWYLAGSDHT